jgi:hypothetical protein
MPAKNLQTILFKKKVEYSSDELTKEFVIKNPIASQSEIDITPLIVWFTSVFSTERDSNEIYLAEYQKLNPKPAKRILKTNPSARAIPRLIFSP